MEHSVNILSELQAISPEVARIGRQLPYEAPAGYFDNLAAQVLQRAKEEEKAKASDEGLSAQEELSMLSPLLSKLDKKTPYEVPAVFFTELTDNVMSGARAIDFVNEELENMSPLMAGLKGKQVYQAPAGYFDNLPDQLLNRVKQVQEPAKVVSIGFGRKVMRYAVAAAVIGIVAMGAWWFTGNSVTKVSPDAVAAKVDKIPEDELESYLDGAPDVLSTDLLAANTKPEIEASDMSDLLQNVSDEEIQKYLDQNLITRNTGTN